MTVKEAVLKSLAGLNEPSNHNKICEIIIKKNYFDFKDAKTPNATVSAILGDFIRNGDSRIKRIKQKNGYLYYLTKNESKIEQLPTISEENVEEKSTIKKIKSFEERDLHILLSSFLKDSGTFSKTIFHEQSNSKDINQIWTHPDMIAIKFLNLNNKASQIFLKSINKVDTFKLSSYELKKEVNNDSDLKKAYFQAVSNSSWANFGYLVAFEFSQSLLEEMERLNQSFGIGIIELNPNPFQSKILFPAKYKALDFTTIDKLCKMNKEFEKFIENIEKIMSASDKYISGAEKELNEFCDKFMIEDTEIISYCKSKSIPTDI